MDCGEFGLVLAGKSGLDPRAQWFAAHIDVQEADHRNRRAHHHAVPIRICGIVFLGKTGLLENFADDAASDIDRAVADVVGIGRAGGRLFNHLAGATGAFWLPFQEGQ